MYQDYNFWADLLTTYRSNPDWLKFLWVFIPAAILVLAGNAVARLIRHALTPAAMPPSPPSPAAADYRVSIDEQGGVYLERVAETERPALLEEQIDLRLR